MRYCRLQRLPAIMVAICCFYAADATLILPRHVRAVTPHAAHAADMPRYRADAASPASRQIAAAIALRVDAAAYADIRCHVMLRAMLAASPCYAPPHSAMPPPRVIADELPRRYVLRYAAAACLRHTIFLFAAARARVARYAIAAMMPRRLQSYATLLQDFMMLFMRYAILPIRHVTRHAAATRASQLIRAVVILPPPR